MFWLRSVSLSIVVLLAMLGCGGSASPVGVYTVEVPQGGDKVAEVGKLTLSEGGKFSMNSGQLQMSGTWAQSGNEVAFTSGNDAAQYLSSHRFRIEGNMLIPQGDSADQKHWRFRRD